MTFARVVAFVLVHFCSSVTLARIERAIIEEVLSRKKHAQLGQPSPAQWIPRFVTRWRIRRATRQLLATLEKWRWEGAQK